LELQNNLALGVEDNPDVCSCAISFKIKKIWLFKFGDDILISTLITTVEPNLRTSWSWNTICIMDWAFTKKSTVDHISRLRCQSYMMFNHPVVDKTTLLCQKSQ